MVRSLPGCLDRAPVDPCGVIEQMTIPGFSCSRELKSSPKVSISARVPEHTNTSAPATAARTAEMPSDDLNSKMAERRSARTYSAITLFPVSSNGPRRRTGWPSASSKSATSAPKSASIRTHHAADTEVERSITRIPCNAEFVIIGPSAPYASAFLNLPVRISVPGYDRHSGVYRQHVSRYPAGIVACQEQGGVAYVPRRAFGPEHGGVSSMLSHI